MGFVDRILSRGADDPQPAAVAPSVPVHAYSVIDLAGDMGMADEFGLNDFFRYGNNAAGGRVNRRSILKNAAVARCVFLISNSIGMLPFQLLKAGEDGNREKARDHPLYELLSLKPNGWQTAFEFRRLMQHRALTDGNAYALIIRSRGAVRQLIPICPTKVKVEQRDDWSIRYRVSNRSGGGERDVDPADILHLRGPSEDGIKGLALTDYAAEVLGLSLRAQEAAARIFSQGVMAGGALYTDTKLSPEAVANLKQSMEEKYGGAANAHKTLVLEEGLKYQTIASTAKDAQNIETRAHQIEEIARIFGVPRPFLMVDDTSWGTGIEQLGIFFVQYGLSPWFKAWEDAVSLSLLTSEERKQGYYPKFNERALLRGSMKDQAEFLSKLTGGSGAAQIMEQNEARGFLDLPEHTDGAGLAKGSQGGANGTAGQN